MHSNLDYSRPRATATLQQLVKASFSCAKPFTECCTKAGTPPSGQSMIALAHSWETEIQRCCQQDGNCCHGRKGHCNHPLQQPVKVDVKRHRILIRKDHAVLISHLQADAGHGACPGAWHAQTISPRLAVGVGLAHHWVSLIPQVAHCNALHTPEVFQSFQCPFAAASVKLRRPAGSRIMHMPCIHTYAI